MDITQYFIVQPAQAPTADSGYVPAQYTPLSMALLATSLTIGLIGCVRATVKLKLF